jgi:hypothetical protein
MDAIWKTLRQTIRGHPRPQRQKCMDYVRREEFLFLDPAA